MRKTVDAIVAGVRDGLHPGAQLFVLHHGGESFEFHTGDASASASMLESTRMLWMSAGKPITAIAIMQQIDKGKATLDTRVADLIPTFGRSGKDAITIRHLLTHTAGFRGPLNSFAPGPWEAIIERCCALRQEPNWTPGAKAGYHVASSWFILCELVRILDGRTIDQYVRKEIFAPVGAVDSTLGISEDEFDGTESIVAPDFPGNTLVDAWTIPRPPANAQGPMRDLAHIYLSLLNHDGKLLKPETSRLMIQRHREGMFDETFKQTLDWGLGFKLDGKRYGHPEPYGYGEHASDATFGHSGNQCACAFADPAHHLVVAWCTNGMPGEPKHQTRQHAINSAIYEDLSLA